MQAALPWATTVDLSYVGQHGFELLQQVNINAIDFGETFLAENQDRTLAPSATPGATAISNNLMRGFQGYGNVNLFWNRGWRTYHSLQLSFQRRFQNGLSFGFNDTIGLSDTQQAGVRLQHNPDGSFSFGRIRPRPTGCSATTTRCGTSCGRTSSGTCRTSGARSPGSRRSVSC